VGNLFLWMAEMVLRVILERAVSKRLLIFWSFLCEMGIASDTNVYATSL